MDICATSAVFQSSGAVPLSIDCWNKKAYIKLIWAAVSLRKRADSSSAPEAFAGFSLAMIC